MITWFAQHQDALRLALRRLGAAPLNTLLSILAIGIALALPAGGRMLLANATQLARDAAPQPQLSVFLRIDADARTTSAAAQALRQRTDLREVRFLAKDDTLARMKGSEGLKDVIEVLGRNPFPDAFVLTPRDDGPQAMESLASALRTIPGVEHVQLDAAWVRRLDALLRLGGQAVTVLALLLAAGVVAITFNIIRLQLLTVRAEIEVSRLLGATEAFIRRPFIYYGGLLGLGGAVVAWLLVSIAALWLKSPLGELASLYDIAIALDGPSSVDSLAMLALASLLGGIGAALSLGRTSNTSPRA